MRSSRKEPKIWVVDQKTFTLTGTIALPAGEGHRMVTVHNDFPQPTTPGRDACTALTFK